MSVATDAILLYGIPLEEGYPKGYDDEDVDYDSLDPGNPIRMAESGDAFEGVVLVQHQSDSYPMFFAAIDGTEIRANRGFPEEICIRGKEKDWDQRLDAFVSKWDLMADGLPGWWLASYMDCC